VDTPQSAWDAVGPTWRLAVDQAWESWTEGSAGVGAVLLDDAGGVVATGRNRMGEHSASHLSGTAMAHAEMDVLSQVPFGTRVTGSLYTTFEPCVMCAATIAFYRVPVLHYAAADPFFDGLVDWLATYPFTAERQPRRVRLGGPVGAFCHVLHLAWLVAYPAPAHVVDAHRRLASAALECAQEIAQRHRLRQLADEDATAVDAITELWPDLVTLTTPTTPTA
jgi:tRNA(Arg) A34 adenosine deaminase TadA